MNPKDLIDKSRNSPVVSFHKFVLLHRKYEEDLFCFYEGRDSQYYYPRVLANFGENHHPIICGNKNSVIDTSKLIKQKYPDFKTAFFVDKDFDESINDKDIYETPCYSIENLYCTENVLKRILKNEFMLKETDKSFQEIVEIFNDNQNDFHESTSLFNLWYATAKEKARQKGEIVNVSLNDKFPKDFINFKIGEISANYDLSTIKQKFPEAIEVTNQEINAKKTSFYFTQSPVKKHRGKYEIEFFLKFLKFIIDDSNKNKTILKKKTRFNVEMAQILSQLSQYAETPRCLHDYLLNCA